MILFIQTTKYKHYGSRNWIIYHSYIYHSYTVPLSIGVVRTKIYYLAIGAVASYLIFSFIKQQLNWKMNFYLNFCNNYCV